MSETLYYEHHWQGSPAAVASALDAVGWRADPTADNPQVLLAPVVWVPSVRRAELGGVPVWFTLVVATEELETPAGLSITPEWLRLPAVGGIAAVDPVPPTLTLLRFMRTLARRGIITRDEALAATRTGAVPAAIDAVFASFPPDDAFEARLTWAAMYEVERANPLLELVGGMNGIDGAGWDSIFREGAA